MPCDDGVTCTTDACEESIDGCAATLVDSVCDDAAFCNDVETCEMSVCYVRCGMPLSSADAPTTSDALFV
jgi:hypothetical protein